MISGSIGAVAASLMNGNIDLNGSGRSTLGNADTGNGSGRTQRKLDGLPLLGERQTAGEIVMALASTIQAVVGSGIRPVAGILDL